MDVGDVTILGMRQLWDCFVSYLCITPLVTPMVEVMTCQMPN